MRVLKISGSELESQTFLIRFAGCLKAIDEPAIIVHGGGKSIDQLQTRLGHQPVKVGGIRHTDPQALSIATMALCGSVSTNLVAALLGEGIDAVGLSGVDGGLMRCRKLQHAGQDLGLVGDVCTVRTDLLLGLLSDGITPVVAPISLGRQGGIFNVNADDAACAIARAVGARLLDFVSNVPGVLESGAVVSQLDVQQAKSLICSGVICDGMVPKVRAALRALNAGVPRVRIVDLDGLAGDGGTVLVACQPRPTAHQTEREVA